MNIDKIEVSHGKGRLVITAVGYSDEEKAQALLAAMSKLGCVENQEPAQEEKKELEPEQAFWTKTQVSKYLGYEEGWITKRVKSGAFVKPAIKGRNMKWRVSDVKKWVDGLEVEAA